MLPRIRPDPTRFMDLHQPHRRRFTGSDRLLRLLSSHPEAESTKTRPPTTPTNASPQQFELYEDDIFSAQISVLNPPNPKNPNFRRRISDRSFGILAALPDRNPNPNLMPKLSVSSSFASSAMAIPPPAKAGAGGDEKKEKAFHSSAPVTIPAVNGGVGRSSGFDVDDYDVEDEGMRMPPHELVARRSPMMMSVVEGVGRTLKGRDLRRVRNAILMD